LADKKIVVDQLKVGQEYYRSYLAELWNYDGTKGLEKGIVPAKDNIIVLFTTEDKDKHSTQYEDKYADGILMIDGQNAHKTDEAVLDPKTKFYSFYRKTKKIKGKDGKAIEIKKIKEKDEKTGIKKTKYITKDGEELEVEEEPSEIDEETGKKKPKKKKFINKNGEVIGVEEEPSEDKEIEHKKKEKKPKIVKTSNGKKVQIIEDENEPSEDIIDKKTGKRKPKKKKIINEDDEIEDIEEIIESDNITEYDEEGNKLPKKRKYKTKDGDIIEIEDEPKIKPKIKKKDKKPKTMKTSDGKQIQLIEDDDEPSEIITDKKTGKKVKKRKIINENGDIEDVDEIIESDITTEYDEEGNKLPKKRNIERKMEK
jgi:hypothetical protein